MSQLAVFENIDKIFYITLFTSFIGLVWHSIHRTAVKKVLKLKNNEENEHWNNQLYSLIIEFLIRLVRTLFFGYLVTALNVLSLRDHLILGFFIWFFMQMPSKISNMAWEDKPFFYVYVMVGDFFLSTIFTAYLWKTYPHFTNPEVQFPFSFTTESAESNDQQQQQTEQVNNDL